MRALVVVDLGFGDAGKGTTVDHLVRAHGADLVVRHHGGAQAGHNVVLPDGRHHTFSQLGAGTFVPGVRTHLGPDFVLHPLALAFEARHLTDVGVPDALDRLTVDPRALVISPFQQAAGRLRELLRGEAAHGTCGVGVGEAVGDALAGHDDTLRVADLGGPTLRAALTRQQARKRAELDVRALDDPRAREERALLDDPGAVTRVLDAWAPVTAALRLRDTLPASARDVVFEGAQGVLLDQTWGLHPHTTWSDCTPAGALALAGDREPVVLGVVRAYATRHGAGPMPTHDPAWDLRLPEPHNDASGWQGAFRRGPLDLPLLRYAARVCGGVDGLVVTCLDRVRGWRVVEVARSYEGEDELDPGPADDLGHRARLAERLRHARPRRDRVAPDALAGAVAEALGAPLRLESHGPTWRDKRAPYGTTTSPSGTSRG